MQLQLVRATRETRQFDEIVTAFTAPMRRVCPHMTDAALREMIERMAMQYLADYTPRLRSSCARARLTARRVPSAISAIS